jgi:hypothetical protein
LNSSGPVIAAPFFVAAGLLVWGGVAKLRRPEAAVGALSAAGLEFRRQPALVRGFGFLVALVGSVCLVAPRPAFALSLSALYVAFTVFLAWLIIRRVPVSSCGCLGDREAPPSVLHIVLNVVAATAGILASVESVPPVLAAAGELPLYGFPFLVGLATAGYLVYLAEAYLPELFFSFRRGERT